MADRIAPESVYQSMLTDAIRYQSKTYAGIAQLVEHNLAKVGVASSSLVSRSSSLVNPDSIGVFSLRMLTD